MQARLSRRPLRLLIVAAMAAGVLTSVAVAAPAATLYDEDFAGGVPAELSDGWGWSTTARGHVGSGLTTRMPTGQHWGASGHIDIREVGAADVDELYWRYWLRLDPDFFIAPPNRGKLPGPAGLYSYNCLGGRVSTPGEPCWSARTLFSRDYPSTGEPFYPDGRDDVTRLGSYVYHLDGPDNRGDILAWDAPAAMLDHGPWYCVEGRVRMNTPGQRDGVLQNWVNGELAFDRDDFRFRRTSETGVAIKSFWMDVYHGGGPSGADNDIWVDSLAFGAARVGCDDSLQYAGAFSDDDDSVFEGDIEWLAVQRITTGCTADGSRFCPDDPVTRGQMAAFLTRALDLTPADVGFDDTGDHLFARDIGALAAAGITTGCTADGSRFCPDDPVTRGQMAAFLTRALDLTPADVGFDDTGDHLFARDIGALAAAGITTGCTADGSRFCPDDPVTRGQMAAFLHRALRGRA